MRFASVAVVLSVLATASPDARASNTSKAWVMGGVGVGYGAGRYRFAGLSHSGYGSKLDPYPSRRFLSFGADADPGLVSFSGGLGVRLSPITALGIGGDLDTLILSDIPLAYSTVSSGYLASGSLMGEVRLRPDGGFVIWQAGLAHAAFSGSRDDVGAADNIVDLEPLDGYLVGLGVGWPFGAVAPFARVRYAELSSEHITYRPVLFNLGVLFQSW